VWRIHCIGGGVIEAREVHETDPADDSALIEAIGLR
jgi:hypothetical protein